MHNYFNKYPAIIVGSLLLLFINCISGCRKEDDNIGSNKFELSVDQIGISPLLTWNVVDIGSFQSYTVIKSQHPLAAATIDEDTISNYTLFTIKDVNKNSIRDSLSAISDSYYRVVLKLRGINYYSNEVQVKTKGLFIPSNDVNTQVFSDLNSKHLIALNNGKCDLWDLESRVIVKSISAPELFNSMQGVTFAKFNDRDAVYFYSTNAEIKIYSLPELDLITSFNQNGKMLGYVNKEGILFYFDHNSDIVAFSCATKQILSKRKILNLADNTYIIGGWNSRTVIFGSELFNANQPISFVRYSENYKMSTLQNIYPEPEASFLFTSDNSCSNHTDSAFVTMSNGINNFGLLSSVRYFNNEITNTPLEFSNFLRETSQKYSADGSAYYLYYLQTLSFPFIIKIHKFNNSGNTLLYSYDVNTSFFNSLQRKLLQLNGEVGFIFPIIDNIGFQTGYNIIYLE